jgi:hypothetical protein
MAAISEEGFSSNLLQLQTSYAYAQACGLSFCIVLGDYVETRLQFEKHIKRTHVSAYTAVKQLIAEYFELYDWSKFEVKPAETWKLTDPFENKKISRANSVRNALIWLGTIDLMSDSSANLLAKLADASDIIEAYITALHNEMDKIKDLTKRAKALPQKAKLNPKMNPAEN